MKTNSKFLLLQTLLLASVIALIFPFSAQAITALQIVQNIAKVLNNIILVIIIIAWIITALLFLMGAGNPNLVGMGKKAAFASIIGTVIYALSNVALTIIENAILKGQ